MAPQNKTERAALGGADDDRDIHDVKFANGDCCFCMPCHGSIWLQRLAMNDNNSTLSTQSIDEETCWTRRWRRFREWLDTVAVTKCKTLLRRFKKNIARNGGKEFCYDPLSYSLNFDEGTGQNGALDTDYFNHNISYRYASSSLPSSTKTSLDFDRESSRYSIDC
ncbi:uncharacterized protein LOC120181742 [Hibiscus syriacus]|nr:uncharacterized protein LOC120181742 [Hibiscus syriacus]